MNEKMTDEALSELLAHIRMELGHGAESDLGAHIAALTAERDDAAQRARIAAGAHVEAVKRSEHNEDVVKALRERVRTLENQGTADWVALCAVVGWSSGTATCPLPAPSRAVAAVVSLVQTLEADLDHSRKSTGKALEEERAQADHLRECYESERNARVTAESRLAAIRQRVETLSPELRLFVERALLNDARPPAPPEAFTHEKGLDAGVFDEAPTASSEMEDVRCKHGLDNQSVCAVCQDDEGPTTAEAFATVRERFAALRGASHVMHELGVESDGSVESGVAKAEAALTLLERRMGAQQRALEETLKLHHRMPGDIIRMIQDALTDAPAVFTLGDIQRAMSGAALLERDRLAVEVLLEQLTAIRR